MNFMKYKMKTNKRHIAANGFTLIETLIAITLVSLISITVLMVFSDTIRFTNKIRDLNRWNRELIKLENILRKSVGEIQIPFWISDIEIIEGSGSMRVPYWNGDEKFLLEMEFKDNIFKIITPDKSTIFKGYDGVEFYYLKDNVSKNIGLSIKVKKAKREDVEFQCKFGAIGREVFNEK